ncbi:DUF1573 domain-containing protein [Gimesia panareensis]|uniref:DUF1573 domain-containing protein n=1 Tax=Gimesia panareensis TaxID=2527978 RepID=UPI00118BC71B|nr:DUF1573 domain-containing protein [Gimesia panareensis]QDU53702.1 hypothetical protein Pan110_60960 [Gimesia panareensis]
MPSGKQPWILFAIAITILTGAADAAEPEQSTPRAISEREFLTQYKAAVARLKNRLQNVQCRVECRKQYHFYKDDSLSKDYRISSHLLVKGDSTVIIEKYATETLFGGTERDLVSCTTPDYAFYLSRTDSDNPFLLNLIVHEPNQIKARRPTDALDMFLTGGNLIFLDPFRLPVEAGRFRIVRMKRIPPQAENSSDLVSLDFILNDDAALFKEGHALFSPDLNWAVLKYEYRSAPKDGTYTVYSGRNSFTPLQKNGIPMLVQGEHNVAQMTRNQKQFDFSFSVQLTDFSFGTVNDAVFRLSNFGLSDTPLAKPSTTTNQQFGVSPCQFNKIPANETARQKITIQNTSSLPLQLLGAGIPCTSNGCASVEGLPLRIPAGQQGSFTVMFKATNSGKFNTEIELYTDQPGQTKIKIPLRGTVRENTKVQQGK